jgi:hypothetical protein
LEKCIKEEASARPGGTACAAGPPPGRPNWQGHSPVRRQN